jgi:hypothetical protein
LGTILVAIVRHQRLQVDSHVRGLIQDGQPIQSAAGKLLMKSKNCFFLAGLFGLLAFSTAQVSATSVTDIVVDTLGHGTINTLPLTSQNLLDTSSGLTTLAYNLPFPGTPGDILLQAPAGWPTSGTLDVIRFDGLGHLFFFSQDISLVPLPISPNVSAQLNTVGPNNVATYLDLSGPGWDSNLLLINYTFISPIPEPNPMLLAALGGALLWWRNLRWGNRN